MKRLAAPVLLLAFAAGSAGAQTMLDQEQRLIQLHVLLLDLTAMDAPGALAPGQLGAGLEVVAVPNIDGTTGNKRQLTASDQTPVFPRPRLAIGLPAPQELRAFAGISYVPPVAIKSVSVHFGAAEAGLAWVPGPLRVGLRAHLLVVESLSPVTDPATRDRLRAVEFGGELAGGYLFAFGTWTVTPYAGLGVVHLSGDFRVESDGVVLSSDYTALTLHAGARLLLGERWEAVAELDAYPGRLAHPGLRLSYVFDLGPGRLR